jgi:hypothetical protein
MANVDGTKKVVMKVLALEQELAGAESSDSERSHRAEAVHVWDLYQAGVICELYFR